MANAKTPSKRTARTRRGCVHHWLVQVVDALIAKGVCRHCGAKRRFTNERPQKAAG